MTRDTADMFEKPERGRFGDNEIKPRPLRGPRVNGASDLVDVAVRLMKDNPLSIAVIDPAKPGSKWIFLPKSQVEYLHNGQGSAVVTMPEWLAIDKGLL